MTIAYITAFIPFGKTETFILEEIRAVKKESKRILIVPRNPPRDVFHKGALDLIQDAIWLPLCNFHILSVFLKSLVSKIAVWKLIIVMFRSSRSVPIFLRNMAVLPKSVYVSFLLRKRNVSHIHAHWAGTTATMAYIIHRLTGIPYSFTLHRWDIYEDNMLKKKVDAASFARCISRKGKEDFLSIVGMEFEEKIEVIHMGVALSGVIARVNSFNNPFIVMTPANLLPVKGHRYMIEACRILKEKGLGFKYWVIGDGPLEKQLRQSVKDMALDDYVVFFGRLPHEKIIQMYKKRQVDAVVLPSINTDDGQYEGIPVSLLEAMSCELPVVSTATGSIPELIGDGSGMMVKDKDSIALAEAIEELIKDRGFYERVAIRGREKVSKEFSENEISRRLVELFELNKERVHV